MINSSLKNTDISHILLVTRKLSNDIRISVLGKYNFNGDF